MRAVFAIALDAILGFRDDEGWAISSHIAMTTLTSLFPFLIFVAALGGVFGSREIAEQSARLLFAAWPEIVAAPIAGELTNVLTAPRGGLLTLGAVLALYFSSSAIEALRIGLNRAYRFQETRAWWLLRLESIAYMLLGSFALLAVALLVVLGPLLWAGALKLVPELAPLEQIVTLVRLTIASLLLGLALVIAHRYLPAQRVGFAQSAPGIILTFICSIGFGEAFGLYLGAFARNYVSTYAGLASVMIALVFLYSIAAIFVFGGELNAAILRARKG